jgi:hypothetical protein
MSERKHADLWNELVDEAAEAEIDRAANVSVEQAEADLRAAGFDVAAERARANAFLEELEGKPSTATATPPLTPTATPTPTPPPRRTRSRPALLWLAAAATSGVVAGGSLVAALEPALVAQPTGSAGVSPENLAVAADLRHEAATACDAKDWSVCLAHLDEARAVDPGGDDGPGIKRLREKAIAGILAPK